MEPCSELHYTHLLNAIPVPMFIVDEDVRILDLNVAACKAFDLSKDAIRQRRGGEVLHCLHSQEVPEGCGRAVMCKNCIVRNAVADCRNAVSTTQRRMKFEVRAAGKIVELELLISASPLPQAAKNAVLLVVENITELTKLRSILPICSHCKRIRNEAKYWEQVDSYFHEHIGVDFSHGLCPECLQKYYGEYLPTDQPAND
jgi:hypothetical protein